MSNLFADTVLGHVDRLVEGERMVRIDSDLKGVHVMRTSCRRLRATVKYLGAALPGARRRSLQDGLRGLMGALGRVRDLDVLRGALDTVPALEAPEAAELKRSVEARRDLAAAEARGLDVGALAAELRAAAALGVAPDHDAPARIWSAVSGSLAEKPADWAAAPDVALHELRKTVKRARYAMEAYLPSYGRPLGRAVERCRALQECLGAIQDVAAFEGLLSESPSFWSGQFLATLRGRADQEREALPGLWEKAFGPKALGRLGEHLFRRAARSARPAQKTDVPFSQAAAG